MTRYIVTTGYVTVLTGATYPVVPGGRAWVDIPRGEVLPEDVPAAEVEQLLAAKRIEPEPVEIDEPAPVEDAERDADPEPEPAVEPETTPDVEPEPAAEVETPESAIEPEPVPAGSVAQVIAWAGADTTRAAAALAAEMAAEKPRRTLIRQLTELVGERKDND